MEEAMTVRKEKNWYPTVLLEVAAATAASLVMIAILAVMAVGLGSILT
jgi:hypothetical protein